MTIQIDAVHRIRPTGISWRLAGNEIVILDTQSSVYFGLGRAGALLWPYLLEGATAAQLAATLSAAMPADSERALADVHSFLAELDQAGLLDDQG